MKKKEYHKSQAALEFLMTYGWAIMVVLTVIGALAYFGVLSPDKFLPNKCQLESGIGCIDFSVGPDSVTMVLVNGMGEDISISDIDIGSCTGTAAGDLSNGERGTFTVSGCSNQASAKFNEKVNITYTGQSGLAHTNEGVIIARTIEDIATTTTTTIPSEPWYDAAWDFRKKITIDSSLVDEDLTDFSVLISLTDTDLMDDAQNDGDDILFTDDDETTKLNHEIESYDGVTGTLVAWVKVPSLLDATDKDIYMYYGNAAAANQENVADTWDANYLAVYHLDETSGAVDDSTSNGNDGTPNGVTQNAAGQIDGADEFDGTDDYIVSSSGITVTDFTMEAWVKHDGAGNEQNIVYAPGSSLNLGYISLSSTGVPSFVFWDDGTRISVSAPSIPSGSWHHVVGVRTAGATAEIFVNGNPVGNVVDTTSTNIPTNNVYLSSNLNYFETLFEDDFNRADSSTVGNFWVETQSGFANSRITSNQLFMFSLNEENSPIVEHNIPETSSGIINWTFLFEFDNRWGEIYYEVFMQLGDGALMVDPGVSDSTGVAVNLLWAGINHGMVDQEGFGYSDSGAVTQIAVVSGPFEYAPGPPGMNMGGDAYIQVIVDLDANTYDIEITGDGLISGSGTATNVPFDNIVDINSVRIYLDELANNIEDKIIDEVIIQHRNNPLDGSIDEARISNIARSDGHISTSYNNQNNPGTFYSVGSEENKP